MKVLSTLLWAFIALLLCLNTNAQDIIYTISGEIDSQKTALDSIAVENLTSQIYIGFGNLPERDDYRINLTRNEYWGSTSVPVAVYGSGFILTKNLPGTIAVLYSGHATVNSKIALHNVNGQRLAYKEKQALENGSAIEVEIGNAGIYFLTISTPHESRTFKASGTLTGGGMFIATQSGTAISLKSGHVYTLNDTGTKIGDNVKVMVFKGGYVSQPVELTLSCNETLVFPLEASTPPEVETLEVTNILSNSATLHGNIVNSGNSPISERGFYWSTTSENPGEADSIIIVEGTMGNYSAELSGLTANTTYYVRAYATYSQGKAYGEQKSFQTINSQQSYTVTDFDGNVYNTVTIGYQVWMAENLKTTHYANGTAIPLVNTTSTWDVLTITDKAYCWYNDDIANKASYGALYTWAAAMNGAASKTTNPSGVQGVCPTGWHLPSDAEWTQMENYLADNGYNYDGTRGGGRDKIAKSMADSSGWNSSSYTGSVGNTDYPAYRNNSGFTALPGGNRYLNGTFNYIGYVGYWWSATDYSATDAWRRIMDWDDDNVYRLSVSKEVGFSVRCLSDTQIQITFPTVTTESISTLGASTATGVGNITSDGGATITARGVCWNTTGNPTIADSKTTNGTGIGTFTSSITGLTANTTYYVRAYATNSHGTSYGEEKVFKMIQVETIPTENLLLYYPFDGNANDESFNLNDGIASNINFNYGNQSNCAYFNGNSNIKTPILSLTYSFTIAFWYKTENSATILTTNKIFLCLNKENKSFGTCWYTEGGGLYSPAGNPAYFDNSWHHVAVTHNCNTGYIKTFFDGVLKHSRPNSGCFVGDNSQMIIGLKNNEWGNYSNFVGYIDELVIYGRALSQSEINILFLEKN